MGGREDKRVTAEELRVWRQGLTVEDRRVADQEAAEVIFHVETGPDGEKIGEMRDQVKARTEVRIRMMRGVRDDE